MMHKYLNYILPLLAIQGKEQSTELRQSSESNPTAFSGLSEYETGNVLLYL